MAKDDKKKDEKPAEDAGLQEFYRRLDEASKATPSSTLNFFGLPQGEEGKPYYRPPAAGSTTVQPRYYEGAEWWPVKTDMTPQQIRALQHQLIQAGLLNTDYNDGAWDAPSRAAFAEVLNLANNQGVEWPDALATYMNSFPMEFDTATGTHKRKVPGAGRTRAPLVTRFTNPNDLAAVANEVSVKRLGRRFTQDEMSKFVQNYQAAERGEQQQQYDAGAGGGSFTAAMDVETAANQAAEAADPVASMARNMLPLVQGVKDLLGEQYSEAANPMQGGLTK